MKKIISMILCLTLLLSCALPVLAADGVPEAVMESTKSVVRIMSEYRKGYSTGSGFVIKNEPGEVLIVTNDHVVEDNPKKISVWVSEDRLVEAQIVVTTSGKDLCILRLMEDVDLKPLTLSEEEPRHGAAIYVVGYPGAGDILSDTQAHTSDSATITDGIISAIRTFTIEKGAQPVQLLQVNAAINAGNSGGPLFNTEGVVVGINTYKVNADSQGVFGSVAVSELWNLMEQYNIVIPEETEAAEATETAEAVPEEEKGESSLSLPVLIGAGVGCLVLVLLLILGSRKKKTGSRKTVVTLKTHLEQYPQGLGISGAVSLLLPVAVQLRNLHNDGRLHLQVCPANILVGAEGASLKEPTQQETGRYNSGFAAPEIYKGAGFGVTSDIYSFAAVLLYAVTGKVPGNSLQPETLEQDLALVEDAAFAAILRKAMASNLLDRTQSMQELIFGIAVYNTSAQEKPKSEKVAVPVKQEPAPKSEAVASQPSPNDSIASQPADRRRNPSQKRKTKLLPIAVVLACGIIAVVLLWKPAENREEAVELQSTEQTETTMPMTPEEAAYAEAETLLAGGETAKAAIAFGKLGDYKDARERSFALWRKVVPQKTIDVCGNRGAAAVKTDGTIWLDGIHDTRMKSAFDWTDIIGVIHGYDRIIGLKSDGTVVYAGIAPNIYGSVSDWNDIVDISAGGAIFGLKSDGTVLSVFSEYSNKEGECNVSDWTDIIAISAAQNHTIGLKIDGTVVVTGGEKHNWGQCDVSAWTDIVAIATNYQHTVGLKSDGTILVVGKDAERLQSLCNNQKAELSDAIDVRMIWDSIVVLKKDGTIRQVRGYHEIDFSEWNDIISISASGSGSVLGLKSDGTIISYDLKIDVSDWTNIKLPN